MASDIGEIESRVAQSFLALEFQFFGEPLPARSGPLTGREAIAHASSAAELAAELKEWRRSQLYGMAAATLSITTSGMTEAETNASIARALVATLNLTGQGRFDWTSDLAAILAKALAAGPVLGVNAARALVQMASGERALISAMNLPANIRGQLGEALHGVSQNVLKQGQAIKVKGSHEWWPLVVDGYMHCLTDIDMDVRAISEDPTLSSLRQRRDQLIKRLDQLSHFAFPPDVALVNRAKILLAGPLNAYLIAGEDGADTAYAALAEATTKLITSVRGDGGHLSATVLFPLLSSLSAATQRQFAGTVGAADLVLVMVKPEAAPVTNGLTVDLEVTNRGNAQAEDTELVLLPVDDVDIEHSERFLSRIPPGRSVQLVVAAHVPASTQVLELEYALSWTDRKGPHSRSDTLKIAPQRSLDWNLMASKENPYPTRPLSQADELKGRSGLLSELHYGFQGRGSFLVTGQKRVGKTSVIQVLLRSLNERADVVVVHLTLGELSLAAGDVELGRLGREILERLDEAYTLKRGVPSGIPIPETPALKDGFNAVFTKYFRQLTDANQMRLAIAIDDLDELPAQFFSGEDGRAFFLALRALMNQGRVSFFLIGSERLPGILRNQAERLNQVKTLAVDYLDTDAVRQQIVEPAEDWLSFTDPAVAEIANWSAGNPYFTSLICDEIWQGALASRSCWVVPHDVRRAIDSLVRRSEVNYFKHFWSDSPSVQEDNRRLDEGKSAAMILALATLPPEAQAFIPRSAITERTEGLTTREAEAHLGVLLERRVVESRNPDLVRLRVPLFAHWVRQKGAADLKQVGREILTTNQSISPLSYDEILTVSGGLEYRGSPIGSDEVRRWLEQAGEPQDQRLLLRLLTALKAHGLFTPARFDQSIRTLHRKVRDAAAARAVPLRIDGLDHVRNCFVTYCDGNTRSGATVARHYRAENRIPKDYCGDPQHVFKAILASPFNRSLLVVIDDFAGSGKSASEGMCGEFKRLMDQDLPDWESRVLVVYAAVAAIEEGLNKLRDRVRKEYRGYVLPAVTANLLQDADRAFSPDNSIFASADDRVRAYELVRAIGLELEKDHPCGHEDSQALIVFPDTVPNNTLPIFWKEGKKYRGKPWTPLFPRS